MEPFKSSLFETTLCVGIVLARSEGSLESSAVHDPKAEEIPSHLHSEIEMSQLSKQVHWCPLWLHPLCVQKSVVRFSIYVALSTPFGQSSCQVRFDSLLI